MKAKVVIAIMLFGISACILLPNAGSYTAGPTDQLTGAPGENTCTDCHNSFALNSGPGIDTIIFDSSLTSTYIPGKTYYIVTQIQQGTGDKFGFQLTVLKNSDNTTAGTLALINTNRTQLFTNGGRNYIVHTASGTMSLISGINAWAFHWTAPSTNVGPVTFYLATNATNDNNLNSGDYIYNTSLTINPNTSVNITEGFANIKSIRTLNGNLIITTPNLNDKPCRVTVNDLTGKLVLSTNIQAQNNMLKIPVSGLQRGVYIFKIESGQSFFVVKEFID